MRNLKKFLALVLAMLMVVSASAVVSADFTDVAADNRYAAAINDLAVKGIVKGTSDTTFGPTQDVTRWQMALFVARTITGEVESDDVWANGIVPFTDVTSYKGAIQCAYLNGIINGTSATTFAPNDGITYVAALKMGVCALGYGDGLTWPWGYYNKAVELGLTNNMDVDTLDAELNRAETAQIIYNVLYATPADGGVSFATKNFSVQTAQDTTLFAITATPSQWYGFDNEGDDYKTTNDVGADYVGLQKLVNGVPNGEVMYVEAASIGIAKADIENYFSYAVELINYDDATKSFTGAILGDAPKTVTNKDVKCDTTTNKVAIDGTTYTPVVGFTGATLINEIVIYDGTSLTKQAEVLLTNADGDIIDEQGWVVAVLAYTSSTGANYYAYKGKVISEAKALEEGLGVTVEDEWGAHVQYGTIVGDEIDRILAPNAYEMKLFDDDRDGKYERAMYTPIYMGVYDTFMTDAIVDYEEREADGLLYELGFLRTAKYVNYTDKAAQTKGAVVVYTYNSQLNKVTVIDILEMQTGNVDRINSTGYNANNKTGDIKLTIDGKVYRTAYDVTTADGVRYTTDGADMGATLIDVPARYSTWGVEEIATEAFIEYLTDREAFIDTLKVDDYIGFYAYNDIIIYASELVESVTYNFAIVDEFADFDLAEIYLDMYVGDEYEEEALVTVMNGYDLADLSSYKFSMLLSKEELYYPGTIYSIDVVEDAYELYEIIDETNYDDYDLINAKVADDSYDATNDEATGKIEFTNGVSTGDRSNRIRTNANTVFYFIEAEEYDADFHDCDEADFIPDPQATTVTPFYGKPDDMYIEYGPETQIWTDLLGYGVADTNGVANIVFVINPVDHNFFKAQGEVYVLTALSMNATEVDSAEDLGLPEQYTGNYYMYSGKAVNLDTGAKLTVYGAEKLTGNRVYLVDENGVVVENKKGEMIGLVGHPMTNAGPTYSTTTSRNYDIYGIWNVNGNDAGNMTSAAWGNYTSGMAMAKANNYYDYVWFTKDPDAEDARDAYIAQLLADKDFIADTANDTNNDGVVDEDDFLPVPKSILDIELVTPMVEAYYIDDAVCIDLIVNNKNVSWITEKDGITDIKVVEIISNTVTSGDAAIEILNAAPQISMIGQPGDTTAVGSITRGELFDAYTADGSIIFVVGYRNNDK